MVWLASFMDFQINMLVMNAMNVSILYFFYKFA